MNKLAQFAFVSYTLRKVSKEKNMAQIVLTLDDAVLEQVLHQAKAENLSSTSWLDKLIKQRVGMLNQPNKVNSHWSSDVQELAGAWQDFPTLEDIRHSNSKNTSWRRF